MPLLQLQTSRLGTAPVGMLARLSGLLAKELGKPESFVMVTFHGGIDMLFGGSTAPACFAALKNIGTFTPADTARLSASLTEHLASALHLSPARIYIEFVSAHGYLWGHDGGTLA
jgi:phenylpyruvate tautomerase